MRNLLTAFFLITMVSCTSVQIRHKTSVPEFTGPEYVDTTPFSPDINITEIPLMGSEQGLYYFDGIHEPIVVWPEGEVKKIIPVTGGIYLLTSKGVVFTADLKTFEYRNDGLPTFTMKNYENDTFVTITEIEDLKDLDIDPENPNNIITCSKSGIYYSIDAGKTWTTINNPSMEAVVKSVTIFTDKNEIHILAGHSLHGLYHKNITQNGRLANLVSGFRSYSEISDILVRKENGKTTVITAYNFSPDIYMMDFTTRIWTQKKLFPNGYDMIEGLTMADGVLYWNSMRGIYSTQYPECTVMKRTSTMKDAVDFMQTEFLHLAGHSPETVCIIKNGIPVITAEALWMQAPFTPDAHRQSAMNKRGIYITAETARNPRRLMQLITFMKEKDLNLIVVDMKDDGGQIRFKPQTDYLKKLATPAALIDTDWFIKLMKDNGIYVAARMVIFKDAGLFFHNNGEFAIKDSKTKKSWRGVRYRDGQTTESFEYWVDPYCPEVWKYNTAIANELLAIGFDEVQFDYIRFPTDADNLDDTWYSYKEKGMTKSGAIASFLKYAGEQINGPISIDIYGMNGWNRAAGITGQDVDMIRRYIDVICPMYYPSHFAESFLNFEPFEERPYRIYYNGTLRNFYLGKRKAIIRPYVQAFRLGYSKYDREFYNENYVSGELTGIADALDLGYTFWNAANNYSLIEKIDTNPGKTDTGVASEPENDIAEKTIPKDIE